MPADPDFQQSPSVNALLASEMHHRFANELASALATLHIVKARGPSPEMIDHAIERIDGQAKLLRFMCEPLPLLCNISVLLARLCDLIVRTRGLGKDLILLINRDDAAADNKLARHIQIIAFELIINALKYAKTGAIEVRSRAKGGRLYVSVTNRTSQARERAGGGAGLIIVQAMVADIGGTFQVARTARSFRCSVDLPLSPARHSGLHARGPA